MKSLKNFLKKRYPESYKTDKNTIIRGLGENPLTMLNRTVFTFDYVTSANRAFLRVETKKDSFYTRPIYAKNHPPASKQNTGILSG